MSNNGKSNKGEAARRIDVTPRTFRRLVEERVLPPMPEGGYDIDALCIIYIRHQRSIAAGRGGSGEAELAAARTELAKQQSERMKFKLAIMRSQFTNNEEVQRQLEEEFGMLNDVFWSVPPLIAQDLAEIAPFAVVKAAADKRVGEAMSRLSAPAEIAKRALDEQAKWIRESRL
jgi:phage terminase Nu1 subunit (DNA packaging protein)